MRRVVAISLAIDAGFLRESVVLCGASSCSGVDLRRTSCERDCLDSNSYKRQNSNFDAVSSFEPGGREFESLRARISIQPMCPKGHNLTAV